MICYYAHCMALYNTQQETRDVTLLEAMGFIVLNPNSPSIEEQCTKVRAEAVDYNERIAYRVCAGEEDKFIDPSKNVMDLVFKPIVQQGCHVVAFRALPDGRIPCGVAQEVRWALEAGKPVFELPSNFSSRVMSLDATKEYLREVGQR